MGGTGVAWHDLGDAAAGGPGQVSGYVNVFSVRGDTLEHSKQPHDVRVELPVSVPSSCHVVWGENGLVKLGNGTLIKTVVVQCETPKRTMEVLAQTGIFALRSDDVSATACSRRFSLGCALHTDAAVLSGRLPLADRGRGGQQLQGGDARRGERERPGPDAGRIASLRATRRCRRRRGLRRLRLGQLRLPRTREPFPQSDLP